MIRPVTFVSFSLLWPVKVNKNFEGAVAHRQTNINGGFGCSELILISFLSHDKVNVFSNSIYSKFAS